MCELKFTFGPDALPQRRHGCSVYQCLQRLSDQWLDDVQLPIQALMRPQLSDTALSMPSTRPSNATSTSRSQRSSAAALPAPRDRTRSTPVLISPRTSVLMKISSSAMDTYYADTCGSPRAPFSDLRNDVGVDEVAHRSTSRPGSPVRSTTIPSSGAEASNGFRLTLGGSAKHCRRSLRASAPREGSDKAEAMRRTRLASSLRTFTSTRTRPWRCRRARCLAKGDFALPANFASSVISGNITENVATASRFGAVSLAACHLLSVTARHPRRRKATGARTGACLRSPQPGLYAHRGCRRPCPQHERAEFRNLQIATPSAN
jgi:hypothetical protein